MAQSSADDLALELRVNDPTLRLADFAALLEQACDWSRGEFTPEGVIDGLVSGDYALLTLHADNAVHSIMVVTVSERFRGSRERILECLLTAGRSVKDWLPFEPQMDDMARGMGCARVRMIGRKGWAQKLPHWQHTGIILEREL